MSTVVPTEFRNWSGSVQFTPHRHETPTDEQELAAIVSGARERGDTVRPRGSGHSSVPLVASPDVLVSLDELDGLLDHDAATGHARLGAGTTLARAGEELARVGLAMENLGDVDYQTLAGATGTGTHGTGLGFGNLSSTIVGGRMVTGAGEVVAFGTDAVEPAAAAGAEDTDDADELRRAAALSLGSLGVLSSLTIRTTPEYRLRRVDWFADVEWVMDHFVELGLANRNVDMYWYPRSDEVKVRTLNPPDCDTPPLPDRARVVADETGPSHTIIPHTRELRFEEMEYMFPLERGMDVFGAIRARVKARHRRQVAWRVLVRMIAADDLMISNCTGRDTMSIALLHNSSLPYEPYFDDMEPLLLAHGGRPHWGKKHSLTAEGLRPMYRDWDRFQSLRREHDPDGVFLNGYLRRLFDADADAGEAGAAGADAPTDTAPDAAEQGR